VFAWLDAADIFRCFRVCVAWNRELWRSGDSLWKRVPLDLTASGLCASGRYFSPSMVTTLLATARRDRVVYDMTGKGRAAAHHFRALRRICVQHNVLTRFRVERIARCCPGLRRMVVWRCASDPDCRRPCSSSDLGLLEGFSELREIGVDVCR